MKKQDRGPGAPPGAKVWDVQVIGGLRVVCVPGYLITHYRTSPGIVGIILPPDAADALLREMRKAGIAPKATAGSASASDGVPAADSEKEGAP